MGRTKGSSNIPWARLVADLRAHPDRWVLFPEMSSVNIRTVDAIRQRRRRQLRLDDGVIRCRRKATTLHEDGTVRCSLLLKFVPKETP